MADLKTLKGIDERDRKMIEEAETLLGAEPTTMGVVKNIFWGHLREDLLMPYPQTPPDEAARCDELLSRLDAYLNSEHPSTRIDAEQEIPQWVIERLFEMGVLGMTIGTEYGGGGFGITSYNRVLERIGRTCGSTAVLVSAHQSIGCKALMLFGNAEQKSRWLPRLAKDWLSAFCLSEPQVGCDAGGQETRCELSSDGTHYILNGEKKWSTSAAISKLFTVMAKQKLTDPKTGRTSDKVTALICTPDMPGIDIFQKNRSKCGIRGTWQARIRFTDVKVPRDHLLHQEGKGLNVAVSRLNYGRCTLSAGMLEGATRAFNQAAKWAQTRYQFGRPVADFELVKAKLARMAALTYAIDAVLYMTTGMLDRHDEDIMVETAVCKVFCSEMGWRCVDDAMQIMGGEGYMTENELERVFRDSRINLIVEGTTEVMQSFIFAYGGKQLAERMLGVKQALAWDGDESILRNFGRIWKGIHRKGAIRAASGLGSEVFLGLKRATPTMESVHESLKPQAGRLGQMIREHSHQFVLASRHYGETIVTRQCVQARLANSAMWLHAWACTLSKLTRDLQAHASGPKFERDKAAAMYFMDMANGQVRDNLRQLFQHEDESMLRAADAVLQYSDQQPNAQFVIPESSPIAKGTGRVPKQDGIKQFPGDGYKEAASSDAAQMNTASGNGNGNGNGNGDEHHDNGAPQGAYSAARMG